MARKSRKQERAEQDAAWKAEEERVATLERAFAALPDGPEKAALLETMTGRIVELYNACKLTEGDAILEFLPKDHAKQLLDWYFHDDAPAPFTTEATTSEDENPQQGQVQGEPQS